MQATGIPRHGELTNKSERIGDEFQDGISFSKGQISVSVDILTSLVGQADDVANGVKVVVCSCTVGGTQPSEPQTINIPSDRIPRCGRLGHDAGQPSRIDEEFSHCSILGDRVSMSERIIGVLDRHTGAFNAG